MTSAVDYLILAVVHRTNEDWHLVLPLQIDDLEGATAACQLVGQGGASITLDAAVVDGEIVLTAESEVFQGHAGSYTGDVLLTLPPSRDLVTHIINLDLSRGVSRHG